MSPEPNLTASEINAVTKYVFSSVLSSMQTFIAGKGLIMPLSTLSDQALLLASPSLKCSCLLCSQLGHFRLGYPIGHRTNIEKKREDSYSLLKTGGAGNTVELTKTEGANRPSLTISPSTMAAIIPKTSIPRLHIVSEWTDLLLILSAVPSTMGISK